MITPQVVNYLLFFVIVVVDHLLFFVIVDVDRLLFFVLDGYTLYS